MPQSCAAALDLPPPEPSGLRIVQVAAAALIDTAGNILIDQRPEGKAYGGYWEFPGGKLEPGELPEFALMRELDEELGIETRPTCYWPIGFTTHAYHDLQLHAVMFLYACRVWRGTPTGREGQILKWVAPKQLYNYKMLPADLPLVAQLIDRI
jgi:8-oxo-dGTP diphosphatase